MIRKNNKVPCVDYNFYREVYHGSIASDKNFDNAELEAEAFVDMITFGRVGKLDEIPDSVRFAICSIADVVVKSIESKKNDLLSESNDGYSITYASAAKSAECAQEMHMKARQWLSNTGLLYRGWSEKYDRKR